MLAVDDERRAALEEAWAGVRRFGWMGSAPPSSHIDHSLGMLEWASRWVQGWEGRRVADIGSGAGVPGLVWGLVLPASTTLHLVERSGRRAAFLRLVTTRLDVSASVRVWDEPAEATELGGDAGAVDVVVARSFGPPARVAAAADHLLGPDGVVVVSEPSGAAPRRWLGPEVARYGWVVVGSQAERPAMVTLARGPRG